MRSAPGLPEIIVGFAVTTTIFLLIFVLPRFTTIYANKGEALPVPTQVLMGMSNFVLQHWIALVVGTLVTGAAVWSYLPHSARHASVGLRDFAAASGRSSIVKAPPCPRYADDRHDVQRTGVSLVDIVETANNLCGNVYFREMWSDVSDKIQTGRQMSDALMSNSLVPRSIAQMICAGEKKRQAVLRDGIGLRVFRAGTEGENCRSHPLYRTGDDRHHGRHHRRGGAGADAADLHDLEGRCPLGIETLDQWGH